MRNVLIVGLGGCCGAVLRYLLAGWIQNASGSPWFPYGTLGVNIIGCLVIGLLGGWVENRELFGPEARLLILTGVLGAFTTFSTFGYETFSLLHDRQTLAAFANVGVHVVLGLAAVWAGYTVSQFT